MSHAVTAPAAVPRAAPRLRIRLAPRARKALTVVHVVASVAILGQLWVNAVLGLVALRGGGDADSAYRLMQALVFGSAAPLSMAALVTGIALGLGTKWGVLRYRWVLAKLVLLLVTVATGITVQGPLLDRLAQSPSATLQWTHLAVTVAQFGLLVAATWLSVFKPGGRTRRR